MQGSLCFLPYFILILVTMIGLEKPLQDVEEGNPNFHFRVLDLSPKNSKPVQHFPTLIGTDFPAIFH